MSTLDNWLLRVSLAVGAIAAAYAAIKGALRVARGIFRVFDTILGVGEPGDPDYRPGLEARLQAADRTAMKQAAELQAIRRELATLTRSA